MSGSGSNAERQDPRRRVGILVYDEVEVLDVAGPFEVFSVASRVAGSRTPGGPPPFEAALISRDGEPVRARAGFVMTAHGSFEDAPPQVLIVPGGINDAVEHDPSVVAWIRGAAKHAEVVASVCTGAFLLAAAGLLDGRLVTTHWEDVPDLAARYPAVEVDAEARWLDHGPVATSAGISAGIDLALHLVSRFEGEELALATARQMEYRWLDREP